MKTTEHTSIPSTADQLSKGDGTLHKAAAGAHYAVERMASAADEVTRKAIPAIDRAAEYAHRTVDKAVTGVTPAAEWIEEQADSFTAAQQKLVRNTRSYVTANPLVSLGMALAAGVLISRILRK